MTVTLTFQLNEAVVARDGLKLDDRALRRFKSSLIRSLRFLDSDFDDMRHTTDEERHLLQALTSRVSLSELIDLDDFELLKATLMPEAVFTLPESVDQAALCLCDGRGVFDPIKLMGPRDLDEMTTKIHTTDHVERSSPKAIQNAARLVRRYLRSLEAR